MQAGYPKHGAVFVRQLADDLLNQGYSRHQVFDKSGLSPVDLEAEKPVVEIDRIASFFEHAAKLTGNDVMGFERGQRREMRSAGLISYIGVSSPNVLSYLQNLSHYRRVFSDAVEVDCDALGSDGVLNWHFNIPVSIRRRQFVEFGASGLVHAIRQATGRNISPYLVTFGHDRTENTEEFVRYFGCEVRFKDSRNSLHFDADDLALPLLTADDELYKVLRNCCEHALELKSRNAPPLIVEVERAISDRLSKGEATQVEVAKAVGMSSRTLSRRLAEEGTTFFKILEGLRQALAMNYLRDSGLSLAETAFLLGYSGLSSFNDAFKRWTGVSPGQYRNQ